MLSPLTITLLKAQRFFSQIAVFSLLEHEHSVFFLLSWSSREKNIAKAGARMLNPAEGGGGGGGGVLRGKKDRDDRRKS